MDTQTDGFIDLVRYVFVKYYHFFGSMKHIRICGYSGCNKLFIEIRERKRSTGFCSDKCRGKHHRKKDPNRYRCRDRQNAWINSKIYNEKIHFEESVLTSYHVYQYECEDCAIQHKGGTCPKLIEKNSIAMKVIDNHYASKKIKTP